MTIERFDTFLDKAISNDDLDSITAKEISYPLKINVNSFINEIIGDGVDRMSELISTMISHRNEQNDFKMNGKLSANSEDKKSNENQINTDFIQQQQQNSGLVFEKQSISLTLIIILFMNIINRLKENISNQSSFIDSAICR
jgi:hypothetical protein